MSAAATIRCLTDAGLTVAVAESLTGGALTAHLVAVPGASAVVRGGIVAYATDLKASLLGVEVDLLAERGPVDPLVARQMADGVRTRLGAAVGVATTGVAGPATQSGQAVGTIFIAVTTAERAFVRPLRLAGGRDQLREATVLAATALLRGAVLD
ncbi:CinA family protein [Pseudactinotalea terrae]|uniref:CinA family protein n=1 Tax=Pseudactinotalea terrae TaxID=1743262 RepID=UPI0012E1E161|nr:nicotinamide-nucleotide amidohydrolase family protein [Pseudactinotalea terrae]